MTMLVVVAHPDDETSGCGSILAAAAETMPTVVVCASRGEAGEVADGAELPPGGLASMRETELRAAGSLLGVAAVELLGYEDSGMSGPARPATICGAPFDDLMAAVRDQVARHRPRVIVTLDAGDGHRDHTRVRDAVLAAVDGSSVPVYLHCLPRTLMHEWLRQRTDGEAYDLPDVGTPDEDVTTVRDTSAYYQARLAAIALHRSQTSPFDGISDDLRRRFLTTEHLMRVRPPWTGGDPETSLTLASE